MKKVTIIGTGPAGLTAAIYAARAGLEPVIFSGLQPGGQLTTTTEVENFPGFSHGIMGPDLMQNMSEQATRIGVKIIQKEVSRVDFSAQPLRIYAEGEEFLTQTVIISTGATAKTLNLPNEQVLMGRGISTCATCDGFFYRGKRVIVIGGGDSAIEEALYLANLCQEVILVHRRDKFRASVIMQERLKRHPKITLKIPFTVAEALADERGLTGVILENTETGARESFPIDGLFYGIGHTPNSGLFLPYVDVDEHGYIRVHNFTHTKTPGVFAAGDIADPTFKQAITAAGMGCQAAIQAAKFIETLTEA